MRIETAGSTSKKTGAKFAAIVNYDDDKAEYVHTVGDDFTLNQVELLAVKFAILGWKLDTVTVSTPNQYVADMLERNAENEWTKTPKSNKELVEEIRGLMQTKKVEIVYEKNEAARKLCKKK